MARYIDPDFEQDKFIAISFSEQILPGSFEYALCYIVDHYIDTSVFDAKYNNDQTGRLAYDPAILLKIVLYAYAKGIVSSRQIEYSCRKNVNFMAISADTQPHFTTIASFVSGMSDEVIHLFRDVLAYCDYLGLIGKDMFAIDGCKLPSNASKEKSGTQADFEKKVKRLEAAAQRIIEKHKEQDKKDADSSIKEKEEIYVEKLNKEVAKLKQWLKNNEDKPGRTGKPRKSNMTDNESAYMKSSNGYIQGFIGVGAVDPQHQIVVNAEAFGEAQEHQLLQPMIEGIQANFQATSHGENIFSTAILTADSGFHTEDNIRYLYDNEIEGYVADTLFRKRDPKFADAEKYQEHKKVRRSKELEPKFNPSDFDYDPVKRTCVCPAGKSLYRSGSGRQRGLISDRYKAPKRACTGCHLRKRCLKNPEKTAIRQVAFFNGQAEGQPETYTSKMKQKIDSDKGRHIYSKRLGTVEPVFGNLQNKGMDRFTLRSKKKVDTQWKLYCMVHNIEKINNYGLAFS